MEFEPDLGLNPDPRIACALVLDVSGSMGAAPGSTGPSPIEELNKGFEAFREEISNPDELASKRAEICVITVASEATVAIPFVEARYLEAREFTAGGRTSMGAGIDLALDELEARKEKYRSAGLEYFRPWLFIITDGAPTDTDVFDRATSRLLDVEGRHGVSVFAIGVGDDANQESLARMSPSRSPVHLKGLRFVEFFEWLSRSVSTMSASSAHGGSDQATQEAASAEQVPLAPIGWAHA